MKYSLALVGSWSPNHNFEQLGYKISYASLYPSILDPSNLGVIGASDVVLVKYGPGGIDTMSNGAAGSIVYFLAGYILGRGKFLVLFFDKDKRSKFKLISRYITAACSDLDEVRSVLGGLHRVLSLGAVPESVSILAELKFTYRIDADLPEEYIVN